MIQGTAVDNRQSLGQGLGDLSIWLLMYYIAYGIYVLQCFISVSAYETVFGVSVQVFDNVAQIAVLLLLIVKFISQRASLRSWVISLAIIGIGYASWNSSGEGWLFWLALFVVCSDEVQIRSLACIVLVVVVPMTVITMVCGATGVIENRIGARVGLQSDAIRQTMGFIQPNYVGYYLMLICIAFSTLRFGKSPYISIVLVALTTALNLLTANSRTSALAAIVFAVMLLIFYCTRTEQGKRIVSRACVIAILACVVISLYSMVNFSNSNPIYNTLDSLLSSRLSLAHRYYEMQPMTLFGSDYSQFPPIYWQNGEPVAFVVDNAFCHLVLRFGMVPSILFFVGFILLLAKLIRTNQWSSLLLGLTIMSAYGLGETLGIRVECDFFLVAMGTELLFGSHGLFLNR